MTLSVVFDSIWFSFGLGGVLIFLAIVQAVRSRRSRFWKWAGVSVFTLCGFALIYDAFHRMI